MFCMSSMFCTHILPTRSSVAYPVWRRAQNRKSAENAVINLEELSSDHIDLIPELRKIKDLFSGLRGPRGVWIQEKHHMVQFSSAGGIPRYLPYRWVGGSWNQDNEFVDARNRFLMAVLGGLSLIIPMLIMTLHKSLLISLSTISVAVLLFAFILAEWPIVHNHLPWVKKWKSVRGQDVFSSLRAKEVLLVTAAYAAVLVVFVGSNGT